ncbi:vitellogenin isoform X1 [Senna tora]|uniref:Vitellogenin isoform X1 n=1 Tax=Senna tora TaxID=362788 RepID=A0A834T1V5_9FABA|nr:vitellogenin isoform X1 [Senna tora]
MCSSKKATTGCLIGILHRILCFPTHPFNQIRDLDSLPANEIDHQIKTKHKIEATSSASTSSPSSSTAPLGIVVRLMGLESMAEIPIKSSARLALAKSIHEFYRKLRGMRSDARDS